VATTFRFLLRLDSGDLAEPRLLKTQQYHWGIGDEFAAAPDVWFRIVAIDRTVKSVHWTDERFDAVFDVEPALGPLQRKR
jgi:hypothetical protein